MELIIDFDNIKDNSKKEWLLNKLKIMDIGFHTIEQHQMFEEYDREFEADNSEIEKGDFITASHLKDEVGTW